MALEAEIARQIYEEVRESARANKRVRIPVDIRAVQDRWPSASRDQVVRAYLIAYELLVHDVAEAVSGPKTPRLSQKKDDGEKPS